MHITCGIQISLNNNMKIIGQSESRSLRRAPLTRGTTSDSECRRRRPRTKRVVPFDAATRKAAVPGRPPRPRRPDGLGRT